MQEKGQPPNPSQEEERRQQTRHNRFHGCPNWGHMEVGQRP